MATVKVSDHFAAPVERVFRYFSDVEHAPAHVSGIRRIDMLTTGPFGLGSRWRETREMLDVTDSAEMEVTSFERNRTYTITHHKAGVRIDTVFWFDASKDGGTDVSVEFELDTGGLPPGFLAPLNWAIAGKVRDVLGHDLADLKKSLELGVP
jgi:uncharacterized protein YndB with AHSA1/START domain